MVEEWRAFALALLGVAIAAMVMLLLVALTPDANRWSLLGPLPGVGIALAIWLVGWPATESFRVYSRRPADRV